MFAGLLAHWLAGLSLQHHERVARIFPLIVGTFCDEGGFTLFWKDVSAAAGTREWVHTLADARPAQLLGRLRDEGSLLDEARGTAVQPRPAPRAYCVEYTGLLAAHTCGPTLLPTRMQDGQSARPAAAAR